MILHKELIVISITWIDLEPRMHMTSSSFQWRKESVTDFNETTFISRNFIRNNCIQMLMRLKKAIKLRKSLTYGQWKLLLCALLVALQVLTSPWNMTHSIN